MVFLQQFSAKKVKNMEFDESLRNVELKHAGRWIIILRLENQTKEYDDIKIIN